MADKLIVKNFGPIDDAELDIKKTTVLIGPQGSGKSTLAKLVAIFGDKIFFKQLILNGPSNYLSNFNLNDYLSKSSHFRFNNSSYEINFQNGEFIPELDEKLDDLIRSNAEQSPMNSSLPLKSINEYIRFNIQRKPLTSSNYTILSQGYISSSFSNLTLPISYYLPTERFFISTISQSILGLMSNNIALPKYVVDFGSWFEVARNQNSEIPIDFLKIRYKYENGIDKVILDNNKEIKLSASASGFQSIIPLKLVIENNFKNDLTNFIIEEPELNLFPVTQKHLIQYLVDRCTQNKNQLMMTTHSPYVLSSLNLLVFAYQTAQKHPERIEEIKAIVPQESWINPDEFAAYYVDEGTVRSIISPKTGLIAENELDGVSDMIGDEFDALMDIYRIPTHETVA
ncbi:MAG: AAA family ATPase [Spirosomataceae bacterium]